MKFVRWLASTIGDKKDGVKMQTLHRSQSLRFSM